MRNGPHHSEKRADAVLRNHIAGELRAPALRVRGKWIVNMGLDSVIVEDIAEIAIEHLRRGNIVFVEARLPLPHAFVREEPERSIAPVEMRKEHRSAGVGAEFVSDQLGGTRAVLPLARAKAGRVRAEGLE